MTEDEIYHAYLKENIEFLASNPFDTENRKAITGTFTYALFDMKMNLIALLEDAGVIKPKPKELSKSESIMLLRSALESMGHDTSHLSDDDLEQNAIMVNDTFRSVGVSLEEAAEGMNLFNSLGYETIEEINLTEEETPKIEQPWKNKRKKKPWER